MNRPEAPAQIAPGCLNEHRLLHAFGRHVSRLGNVRAGDRVLIALSGGLDSTVLLHLLRFGRELPTLELEAAHFDHRMRAGSDADADWVRGLTAAWGVPLTTGVAAVPCISEDEARHHRYEFLHRTRLRTEAQWLLTAHHADDQAETVLFRIFRGTGVRGLRGILERRGDSVLRLLLPFWREEIEAYATHVGLVPRTDPSNGDLSFSRNRIRHDVIPALERGAAPRIRASLVQLAEHARDEEDAWAEVMPLLLDSLRVEGHEHRISVALSVLARYDSPVRARVFRELARRLGGRLDSAATQAALAFSRSGDSGREVGLPGGLTLIREFDRLVLVQGANETSNMELEVTHVGKGAGEFVVGGRRYRADWSDALAVGRWVERFGTQDLALPLYLREWRAGDRMTFPYGRKKLKKLFTEARIPSRERRRRAVLADARGRVLWVPGVARSTVSRPTDGGKNLTIGIVDAEHA